MSCKVCEGTFVSWDHRMLEQLTDGVKAHFPVILTRKYACDQAVVTLLRARTLGNSPSALQHNLQEVHSEEWLRKQLCYLSDCERHRKGLQQLQQPIPHYKEATPFQPFYSPKWFLAVYVRDVWSRLPTLLAAATSIYGSILKVDSTKKICKKLQGAAANSVQWATNIGNERGEIVISILTESEGISALQKLAVGLMERYDRAGQQQPQLVYTDRDCCSQHGPSKYQLLFFRWDGLQVRLDVWHFMRRLAGGCTSEAHPLYGTFMAQLSNCIFEWDFDDFNVLMSAKRGELIQAGVPDPSESAVKKAITRGELAKHCRRRTRGAENTVEMIEALLLALSPATDAIGVPLLKEEMRDIWAEQKHHVPCLQDPPGVQLYTVTKHITKGGVRLPVVRCARGSTSLESFHLHLARFIPGNAANAVNFQAYLLDGITRWNAARTLEANQSPREALRTFDVRLQDRVNALSQSVHGTSVFPQYRPPAKYTGELYGVEYLYHQTGLVFEPTNLDTEIDEGFGELEEDDYLPVTVNVDDPTAVAPPTDESDGDSGDEEVSVARKIIVCIF